MKKSPKIIHCLDMGSYPGYTMFIRGFAFDEVKQFLNKNKSLDWLDAFEYVSSKNSETGCWGASATLENIKTKQEKKFFFIYIATFQFEDYDYVKLAHECLHICQFYLPDILDRNKEHEAECYLHTHLMNQCLKALRG